MATVEVLRYVAFTDDPDGGNPAGIVLNAKGLDDGTMQRIAAEIGFSETAFLVATGPNSADIRYFAPIAEVPFCGHATIATAVALAARQGPGALSLRTRAGPVEVRTAATPGGIVATLVSVRPRVTELTEAVSDSLLRALRLERDQLDPALPLRVSYAGNSHPIVGVPLAVLDELDQDQDRLAAVMAEHGWGATVAIVTRIGPAEFEARHPFPPGGVREDPATGSGAAALGAYLRALGLIDAPARIVIRQGRHLGRPAVLTVDIPAGDGGIAVSGQAVPMR